MLRPVPQQWAQFLPGYGVTRVLFDTSLTTGFDVIGSLLLGLGWLASLLLVAGVVLARGGKSA
jgi:hypothetical protein